MNAPLHDLAGIRARLQELQAHDLPVHGGRTLAYVYDAGLPEVDDLGRAAVAAFAGSSFLFTLLSANWEATQETTP